MTASRPERDHRAGVGAAPARRGPSPGPGSAPGASGAHELHVAARARRDAVEHRGGERRGPGRQPHRRAGGVLGERGPGAGGQRHRCDQQRTLGPSRAQGSSQLGLQTSDRHTSATPPAAARGFA